MLRRINLRIVFLVPLLAYAVYAQLAKEHRPTMLRPGVRMYAYVANIGDGSASPTTGGSVSVVDLVKLATVATVPVGPSPSGVRAHPTRDEIWGVSTGGGFVWVLDANSGQVKSRIPLAPSAREGLAPNASAGSHAEPFAVDFNPKGTLAYVAASGSGMLFVVDCATQKIVGSARTGRRPWLARVTPNGKLVLVPNRDDSTVSILDASSLATIATVPVAAHPESVEVLPDSKKAFVSASGASVNPSAAHGPVILSEAKDLSSTGAGQISVLDLKQFALLTNLTLGGTPTDLVLKSDGGELYAPSPATNGIAILNTWTNEVTEHVVVGDAPSRAALTSDADNPFLFVTDSAAGRVLPIQINFRRVLLPVSVGRHPGVARLTPARAGGGGEDVLLVVNEDSDDLAVIRVRTQSLLTSQPRQSLLTMIPVGHRPRDIAVKVF